MIKKNEKISIVVAVYNVSKYLHQCLDSLCKQTYNNLEIICIDDGSTDESGLILDEYASKDSRILVVHQENEGVAGARNKGIELATGKYLMFTDGDDWLEENACEILIEIMEEETPDVIMYSYYREYENKTLTKNNIFDKDYIVFNEEECNELHRRHAGILGEELRKPENADALCSMMTKMYITEFVKVNKIEQIDLKVIGTNEDGIFNLYYFEYVKKAIFINRFLYHYRKTNASSITSVYKKDFSRKWNTMFDIIEQYIRERNLSEDFLRGLKNRIVLSVIGLGLNEIAGTQNIYSKYKAVRNILRGERYRNAIKKFSYRRLPFHWSIFFFAAKFRLSIIVFVMLYAITKLKKVI